MTGLCAVVEGIDSNVLSLTQQGGADAIHSMFPILPPVHIYQSPTESYKVLVARLKATGPNFQGQHGALRVLASSTDVSAANVLHEIAEGAVKLLVSAARI